MGVQHIGVPVQFEAPEKENHSMSYIILTVLSTVAGPMKKAYLREKNFQNIYYDDTGRYTEGYASVEPGTKYFLANYDVEKIIAVGSRETFSPGEENRYTVIKRHAPSEKDTAWQVYLNGIADYLKHQDTGKSERVSAYYNESDYDKARIPADIVQRNIRENCMQMVPKDANRTMHAILLPLINNEDQQQVNFEGIINEIRRDQKEDIRLLIDTQGGTRTDWFVMEAALNIVGNASSSSGKISVEKVLLTRYNRENPAHPICDVTNDYDFMDFASGMNAFLEYGRADQIEKYLTEVNRIASSHTVHEKAEDPMESLCSIMVSIDHSLSYCDIGGLAKQIQILKKRISSHQERKENGVLGNIAAVMENAILDDYAPMMQPEELHYRDLAGWALNKKFYQAALTIIESNMPEEIVKNNLIGFSSSVDKKQLKEWCIRTYYAMKDSQLYQLNDAAHFLLKVYLKTDGSCISRQYDQYPDFPSAFTGDARLLKRYQVIGILRNAVNHASLQENRIRDLLKIPADQEIGDIHLFIRRKMEEFLQEYDQSIKKNHKNLPACAVDIQAMQDTFNKLGANSDKAKNKTHFSRIHLVEEELKKTDRDEDVLYGEALFDDYCVFSIISHRGKETQVEIKEIIRKNEIDEAFARKLQAYAEGKRTIWGTPGKNGKNQMNLHGFQFREKIKDKKIVPNIQRG